MFFTIKLYLHLNGVLMLNWILWNSSTKFTGQEIQMKKKQNDLLLFLNLFEIYY